MMTVYAMPASTVRNQWSSVMDSVIHRKPAFIQRTRGTMLLCSTQMMAQILGRVEYTADEHVETDGSFTLTLDNLGLAVNEPTLELAKKALCEEIMEYAQEYYDNYELFSKAPNRADHLPWVIRACIAKTSEELESLIVCRAGQN